MSELVPRAEPTDPFDVAALWTTPTGQTDDCRRCGRRIILNHYMSDGRPWWYHFGDRGFLRGCRAASFTDENGWDETLDPHWVATPTEKEKTA